MLDIQKIRAITLDLDDTLWPIWPTIARAETALQDWLRGHAPRTSALFADPAARLALRHDVMAARPDLHHQLSSLRLEQIRLALGRSDENTALAEPAFEVFFDARQQVTMFDDTHAGLAFLSARFPLVALSNGNADLARVGLSGYFKDSISAQGFGVGKPDPRIFKAAASAAGVLPEEVLHIGDDAALDVLGALACGMQTVWVNREDHVWTHDAEPHETVTTLTELTALFDF
ncbi:MAG: HAD-IA family hydrolase [Polaromonas sp.]|nr:HAD-IA family hydrolase [Polaromonas sp.]